MNNTDYYIRNGLEAITVIDCFFNDNPYLATAFKYLARCGHKGDEKDAIKDLEKSIDYIEHYIERLKWRINHDCNV